jgi:hypothetical protein
MLNIILLTCILFALFLSIEKCSVELKSNKPVETFINMDNIYYINKEETKPVSFSYEQVRPIDQQFQNEQLYGVQLSTWYPNTWIEKIDENGNPVYNSREKVTGVKETFIESKARFSYEFNSPRSFNMDGVADPTHFHDGNGRTLQEIYDNSFVDFKKMVPKKTVIKTDEEMITNNAGSNLSFVSPDNWVYENEKPENGGTFNNGLMADDPYASSSISNSYAVVS